MIFPASEVFGFLKREEPRAECPSIFTGTAKSRFGGLGLCCEGALGPSARGGER